MKAAYSSIYCIYNVQIYLDVSVLADRLFHSIKSDILCHVHNITQLMQDIPSSLLCSHVHMLTQTHAGTHTHAHTLVCAFISREVPRCPPPLCPHPIYFHSNDCHTGIIPHPQEAISTSANNGLTPS